eukprot:1033875-Rhodomonas_salina.9
MRSLVLSERAWLYQFREHHPTTTARTSQKDTMLLGDVRSTDTSAMVLRQEEFEVKRQLDLLDVPSQHMLLTRARTVTAHATDLAYVAIGLRSGYAISGTDAPYAGMCLRSCYAMSGTDLAYGATRSRT